MIKIALIGALSDEKFKSKVEPLIALTTVEKVYLFRYAGNPLNTKYAHKLVYKKPSLPKPLFFITSFFSILFLGILNKIDFMVGVYFYPYGVISGLAGVFSKVPVIHILPGSDLNSLVKEKRSLGILKKGFKIGVRGSNSLQALKKLGIPGNKLFILQNAFELPEIKDFRSEKKWDIIFVGYLRKPKRIELTVEVVEKLKERFPKLSCVIVGDGPEFENIQKLIVLKGLEKNISMVGHRKNVDDYLIQSKIFLLTSESEGLPMVLVEALAHGLPVVSSDINDISDLVIDGKNGFLIPSLKLEDYADALKKIIENNSLYSSLSSNAQSTVKQFHQRTSTFKAVQNTWDKILKE